MFWWFERDGEFLRLEVLELTSDTFELRVIWADGSTTTEVFPNASDLAKRQMVLQEQIRSNGWRGPHGSVM